MHNVIPFAVRRQTHSPKHPSISHHTSETKESKIPVSVASGSPVRFMDPQKKFSTMDSSISSLVSYTANTMSPSPVVSGTHTCRVPAEFQSGSPTGCADKPSSLYTQIPSAAQAGSPAPKSPPTGTSEVPSVLRDGEKQSFTISKVSSMSQQTEVWGSSLTTAPTLGSARTVTFLSPVHQVVSGGSDTSLAACQDQNMPVESEDVPSLQTFTNVKDAQKEPRSSTTEVDVEMEADQLPAELLRSENKTTPVDENLADEYSSPGKPSDLAAKLEKVSSNESLTESDYSEHTKSTSQLSLASRRSLPATLGTQSMSTSLACQSTSLSASMPKLGDSSNSHRYVHTYIV